MSRSADRCSSCGAHLARDNASSMCSACQRNKRGAPDGPPVVPPEFWSADLIQRSLQEWHMGKVIAAYRTHPYHPRPLPQEQVARWLGITQAQLSRIENGDPITDLSKLIDWAVLLGIPAHLLWFRLPGSSASPSSPGGYGGSPGGHVSRLADDAATSSMHFARTTAETGLAGEAIDHLRWEVSRLAVDYVHVPLHVVFADLLNTRDAVFDLLSKRHRPRDARQLYLIAGAVCDLLAQGSIDSGNYRAATAQLRAAWTCAQMCDDDGLRAWIQGTAAVNEEWNGCSNKALEHAVRGTKYRSSRDSRIRLAAIQARGSARIGDHERTGVALDQLQKAQDGPTADDSLVTFGGFFTFPEAKQHFYVGSTRYLLGQHAKVEPAAASAIHSYETGPPDERSYGDEALARVDLINARIVAGDFDGAGDAIDPLVDLPAAMRIGPLHVALGRTKSLLQQPRFASAKAVHSIIDRLATIKDETLHHQQLLASSA